MTTALVEPPGVPRPVRGLHIPPPPRDGGDDDEDRGPAPQRPILDNVRLAMIFLISGEIMFFGGLISAFLVLRVSAAAWPPPLQPRLPIAVTGLNTLVLLAALVRRLLATAALGAVFLLVQGYEWTRLVSFGLTLSSGVYGATFYTLIGAHAAHVVGALVWLAAVLALAARGRFVDGAAGPLRACAMYWHFVVALWPILYVAVYLA